MNLSSFFTSFIINSLREDMNKDPNKTNGLVRLHKFILIFGVITSVIFLIPASICFFVDKMIVETIVFSCFSLLGVAMIIAYFNCRIKYDEQGFCSKSFFGIKNNYTYSQVTGIKKNPHETIIILGKKRVMIDEFSVGGKAFITYLKKMYNISHNGKPIPSVRKSKADPFNGHVKDPGGFIAAFVIATLVIVSLAGVFLWDSFHKFTPENTIKHTVSFDSYTVSDGDIILNHSGNERFEINHAGDFKIVPMLDSIFDGKTTVTVYSKKYTPDDEPEYYSVKAILRDSNYVLTFDETRELNKQAKLPLLWFPIIILAAWFGVAACTVIVGRNPKKFGKRIVRLFFKDGYINY